MEQLAALAPAATDDVGRRAPSLSMGQGTLRRRAASDTAPLRVGAALRGHVDEVSEDAHLEVAVMGGFASIQIFVLHEVEYIWELRCGERHNETLNMSRWATLSGGERKTSSRALSRGTLLHHSEPHPQFKDDKDIKWISAQKNQAQN